MNARFIFLTRHSTHVAAFVLLSVLGCTRSLPESGFWKGSLTAADHKPIAFTLHVDFRGQNPVGYFLNGDEQTPLQEIFRSGDSLTIVLSEYGAAMRGLWTGSGWEGRYERYRTDTSWMPFSARPAEETRALLRTPDARRSLFGSYTVFFEQEKGVDSSATARFWARADSTFGTLIAPDGDYGLFAGRPDTEGISLSRFNGWQAMRIDCRQQGEVWSGLLYVRNLPPQRFTLRSLPIARPTGAEAFTTRAKNPEVPFTFFGIDQNGTIVRSGDDQFRNKVVLVDIMGTWCHNCMDAAPLLQRLTAEFSNQGFIVVGLSFELKDDARLAAKNIRLFTERYGITYPVLYCGSLDEGNVSKKLRSQLENFGAYPTSIFLDRRGRIKRIHIGFRGIGTGEGYQEEVASYTSAVRKLLGDRLSESAPRPE